MPAETITFDTLAALLKERLEVIGNQTLRSEQPERHLAELQRVSEAVFEAHAALRDQMHPRLEHFMANGSYQKALDYLDAQRKA